MIVAPFPSTPVQHDERAMLVNVPSCTMEGAFAPHAPRPYGGGCTGPMSERSQKKAADQLRYKPTCRLLEGDERVGSSSARRKVTGAHIADK